MYPLTCVDGYRIPVREEVYVLDIIPLTSGPATISSDQKLALFNPTSLKTGPHIDLITRHSNIACAKAFDVGSAIVCTAGEDGSVSMWDLRQDARQAEVARLTDNRAPVLSLACSGAGFSVVAGTELQDHQASILVWDVRSTPTPKLHYKEVHSDDVTELNFHPSDHNILLSGSTDGLVNICDTRITDEDEVVVQTFNHDASIHHAAFLNDTEVFAISHDEKLALYDMAENHENGAATADFGDMRSVLGCQYVANVIVKANGAGAVIGAGAHDQQAFEMIHLNKGQNWNMDRESSVGLPGAHSSEIVRSFCFYDEAQTVFSAGEDGYIKAWRPNA
ncbi:WD40-repeat-containing domain protein [Hypoxylon crocopeplum]|nr:WD40-repeat-containing domain protein [Hypoxylon crocopeplum]